MEVSTWVALGSAIVALLSFLDRLAARKQEATATSIKDVDKALDEFKKETDQRFTAMLLRISEQNANIAGMKLEIVTATANVPTREHLDQSINSAMAPVAAHMNRVDRFMEAAYQSGAFIKRD